MWYIIAQGVQRGLEHDWLKSSNLMIKTIDNELDRGLYVFDTLKKILDRFVFLNIPFKTFLFV